VDKKVHDFYYIHRFPLMGKITMAAIER